MSSSSAFLDRDAGPSAPHFLVAGCFALGFVAARSFLDRFIFRRFAISLLSLGSWQLKIIEAVQAKTVKCSESMWKLTNYFAVEYCVLKITYHEPWFWDTSEYFKGWPNQELKWLIIILTIMRYRHRQSACFSTEKALNVAWLAGRE